MYSIPVDKEDGFWAFYKTSAQEI